MASSERYSPEEVAILDDMSRWLSPILRYPEEARRKHLKRDQQGWVRLKDVEQALRNSHLWQHARFFRRMLQWSVYDLGREAGNPRFLVEEWKGEEYIRAAKKVREENDALWSWRAPPATVLHNPMALHVPATKLQLRPRPAMTFSEEKAAQASLPSPPPPPPPPPAPPAVPAAVVPAAVSKARVYHLPQGFYKNILDFWSTLTEMKQAMAVSRGWRKNVEPLLRCPGRKNPALAGLKDTKLPCGHRVCAKCQQERRKCPKCGKLTLHAAEYWDLRSQDDPRTSIQYNSDAGSERTMRTISEAYPASTRALQVSNLALSIPFLDPARQVLGALEAPNPAAPGPYRWIRRPAEALDPFTPNSDLDEAENKWAQLPFGRTLQTRYWAFFHFERQTIARVQWQHMWIAQNFAWTKMKPFATSSRLRGGLRCQLNPENIELGGAVREGHEMNSEHQWSVHWVLRQLTSFAI